MKEIIIQLTKKKTAILTVPSDMHVGDVKILLKQIMLHLQSTGLCKHEEANYNNATNIAACKGCGKQLN